LAAEWNLFNLLPQCRKLRQQHQVLIAIVAPGYLF